MAIEAIGPKQRRTADNDDNGRVWTPTKLVAWGQKLIQYEYNYNNGACP